MFKILKQTIQAITSITTDAKEKNKVQKKATPLFKPAISRSSDEKTKNTYDLFLNELK